MRVPTGASCSATASRATCRRSSTSSGTCSGIRNRGPKTPAPTRSPRRCARNLVEVVNPLRARVHAQFLQGSEAGNPSKRDAIRVRTVFALRFGRTSETADGAHISQDAVRSAFNSPFRPFVLASTSIGQEGLDFHPWCHRLIHWNLPGNPVDLEQREGRVHRYKGHAVRRNVAASHGSDALRVLASRR